MKLTKKAAEQINKMVLPDLHWVVTIEGFYKGKPFSKKSSSPIYPGDSYTATFPTKIKSTIGDGP